MIGDETDSIHLFLGAFDSSTFIPLKTICVASSFVSLVICFKLAAIFMTFLWPKQDSCDSLYITMYCHCALWFITLVFDHYLKWKHNILRLNGYLVTYKKLVKYGSLPFYIVSLGICVLVAIMTTCLQLNLIPFYCTKNEITSPLIIVLGVTIIELSVLTLTVTIYIVQVFRFNKLQPEAFVDSFTGLSRDNEVGCRERGANIEDLVQNQADLILYYKDLNELLQRKIMGLTSRLRGDTID
uniref:Transmembrane protein 192 n=1 Tax=Clastoptera arizonana TaxID=38151 RepID=A0A1B6C2W8_9HEMI